MNRSCERCEEKIINIDSCNDVLQGSSFICCDNFQNVHVGFLRSIGCVYCSIDVVLVLEYREAEGIISPSPCVFISNSSYKSNFWKEKEMKIERIERRN